MNLLDQTSQQDLFRIVAPNRSRELVKEALEIEQSDAIEAGAIGFMSRVLAQVTLPHLDPKTLYYERSNGKLTLSIRGHKLYGIPYGTIPRILLAWICTEAARTKSQELALGKSASEFARKIQLGHNGRDLARLKKQALALSRALISIDGLVDEGIAYEDIKITSRGFIFWTDGDQDSKWQTRLAITEEFYKAVTTCPFPLDLRIYHALSKSPLAMDIYAWLAYRIFTLRRSGRREVKIPWVRLKAQFSSAYADDEIGLLNFRQKVRTRLKEVLLYYRDADGHVVADHKDYLVLTPCRLAIPHTGRAILSKI